MTMPGMPTCQSCLDAGYIVQDGEPYSCHCKAGVEWARKRYDGRGKSWASAHELPPGGDVMAKQAARTAAGLPVGALEGMPIRAMLVDDRLMQAALDRIARLMSCLEEGNPERRSTAEWLMKLPEQYRATMPAITSPTSRTRTGRRSSAAPVRPPGS